MDDWKAYKQIIAYMDQLHKDIGQLVLLIDQLLAKELLHPVDSNRITRGLSSQTRKPFKWRIPYVRRVFVSNNEKQIRESIFYLIWLNQDAPFEFPTMVCGRFQHETLTEKRISDLMYKSYLTSLTTGGSKWRYSQDENGWNVATPTFDSRIQEFQGYILNLFDISDRQVVAQNVIQPLSSGFNRRLSDFLTIPTYPFPVLVTRE
mgnify:CR=1 FL=1